MLVRDRHALRAQDIPANRPSSSRTASTQDVETQPRSHSDLRTEREELIKVLQAMIGTAMRMVKITQRDMQMHQTERDSLDMGATATRIRPARSASASVPALNEDLDPNEILAFKEFALARTETIDPSQSQVALPATRPADDPPEYSSVLALDLSDTYNPSSPSIQLRHHYANAQTLIALGNPLEALSILELAHALLSSVPSPSPDDPPEPPTPADILFLIAHICLQPSLKRITRARHVLKEIYTSSYTFPAARRYEAAHMLAQLYMFVDGNPDDPTIDWDGMSMNLEKSKEYVIAAVQGRKRLLGRGHLDTQKSVELLTTLCERIGSRSGAVLKELLEVFRETFEGSDDGGREGEEGGRWD
jgi:hypothetical protein